jgi:RNA polymerase sigma-70 factor (ECF subfamily)
MPKAHIQSEAVPHLTLNPFASLAGQNGGGAPKLEDRFVKLFDELRIPISRHLRHIGVTPEDAEDIVQELFLRLFKHLREKGEKDNIQGWAFRVAHNLAVDQYKDKRRFTTKSSQEWAGLSDLLMDQALNPEEFLIRWEKVAGINQAINSLSSRQLQCVYLRSEGFQYREIAEILGVTMGTVTKLLHRAIKKLQGESMEHG